MPMTVVAPDDWTPASRRHHPPVPDGNGSGHRRGRLIAVGVMISILVIAIIALITVRVVGPGGTNSPGAGTTPSHVVGSATSTSDAVNPSPGASRFDPALPRDQYNQAWQNSQHDLVIQRDVAPGINRCASRLHGVALEETYGIGTAFPRSLEGGVAFSAAVLEYRYGLAAVIDAQHEVMEPLMFEPFAQAPVLTDAQKQGFGTGGSGTDGNGNVIDASGAIIDQEQLLVSAHPEYGAYQVLAVNTSARESGKPVQDVYVQWWLPRISGIGNDDDLSGVLTNFSMHQMAVLWDETAAGWRVALMTYSEWAPYPQDQTYINHPFAERAAVLGPGWCVAADATEDWQSPVPLVRHQ